MLQITQNWRVRSSQTAHGPGTRRVTSLWGMPTSSRSIYYFRVAGTFLGGSSSGSPCTLSDPSCSFDSNRSSALGIVSTGPLARFRGLPLLSRITIGYSPSFGASFALSAESRSHLIAAARVGKRCQGTLSSRGHSVTVARSTRGVSGVGPPIPWNKRSQPWCDGRVEPYTK